MQKKNVVNSSVILYDNLYFCERMVHSMVTNSTICVSIILAQ